MVGPSLDFKVNDNFSDGFWGLGESYSKKFQYMGRDGIVYDYKTCKDEAINYYKSKNIL